MTIWKLLLLCICGWRPFGRKDLLSAKDPFASHKKLLSAYLTDSMRTSLPRNDIADFAKSSIPL